ncbi:MAG: hypothetical protein AVDCRST_MAG73-2958 [uncultured Thermomicrobiales bacterium]|uniref:Uncharacterized protein n=1 Tax=uncultured Thermomicrobiales bacterium TaxID=1645740 RepID=A0A6J4UL48_9BACT|nr:MAG: hypothetical protein AVDCRST_MAG73-2958 [uncultured Thermomicrobiales bacterium]
MAEVSQFGHRAGGRGASLELAARDGKNLLGWAGPTHPTGRADPPGAPPTPP